VIKKIAIFGLFLIFTIGLAACGSDESTSGESNDILDVAIDDASYILAGEGGTSGVENKGMLAVTMEVTNNTEQSIDVSPFDGIKLYDEGEQKSPQTDLYNSKVELESAGPGEIGPEKMKKITAIFYVEKDKEYEIGVKPLVMDPEVEPEEVTVPLNTADYADSFDTLDNPAKALLAYVDTVYLDQDNPDYEKLVSADKAALQEDAKDLFADRLEMVFPGGIPEEELDKYYETYKSLLAQKAEISAETSANANDKAVVLVDYSTLPLDLFDPVREYTKEYRDNTGDWDTDSGEEYALSKLDNILDSIEPKKSRETLEILMVKEDGKWSVDTSDYNSERLAEAFSAGRE